MSHTENDKLTELVQAEPEVDKKTFEEELRALINKHSLENGSSTPDFILASFLSNVLTDWNHATRARDRWFDSQR